MKISARNQLRGIVKDVQKGQTTAHIRIDVGHGIVLTTSITNEAVDELDLKPGDENLILNGNAKRLFHL